MVTAIQILRTGGPQLNKTYESKVLTKYSTTLGLYISSVRRPLDLKTRSEGDDETQKYRYMAT